MKNAQNKNTRSSFSQTFFQNREYFKIKTSTPHHIENMQTTGFLYLTEIVYIDDASKMIHNPF